MLTEQEAIKLLTACCPLLERVTVTYSQGIPAKCPLTHQDL